MIYGGVGGAPHDWFYSLGPMNVPVWNAFHQQSADAGAGATAFVWNVYHIVEFGRKNISWHKSHLKIQAEAEPLVLPPWRQRIWVGLCEDAGKIMFYFQIASSWLFKWDVDVFSMFESIARRTLRLPSAASAQKPEWNHLHQGKRPQGDEKYHQLQMKLKEN